MSGILTNLSGNARKSYRFVFFSLDMFEKIHKIAHRVLYVFLFIFFPLGLGDVK